MPQKLAPLEKLLVSKSGYIATTCKSITFALIGVYGFGTAAWMYFVNNSTQHLASNLLIGCAAVFVINYRKLVYVSPEGMARDTHTWFAHYRELLKWNDVKSIGIMYKGSEAMVFLEQDVLGGKYMFDANQIDDLKKLFKKYLPGKDINEIDRNKG